jgi:Flp pilus assembly protein TadG
MRRLAKRNERGIQIVEMAFLFPLMLLLIGAIVEFGNFFYTYTSLAKATRAAARHLSSHAYTSAEIAAAKNIAVCGSTSACGAGSEILEGLTTSNIQVTNTGTAFRPTTVTVQIINYNYDSVFNLTSLAGNGVSGNALGAKTTMRYTLEY